MNLPHLIIFCFVAFIFKMNAHNDSVKCDQNLLIKEGVYLSYLDFRTQKPILKENIENNLDKSHIDFISKSVKDEKLNYLQNGQKLNTECKNIWGFYQNNTLHLNYAGEFYRVPLFGSISYLIATVEVINSGMYTPGYSGIMTGPIRTKEMRSFLMNFYDGKIIPFSQGEAEELISRDKELYSEFKKLKAKQRKDQISRYIRKYNEQNPIYFLK